ncbi:phosphodiester glycosidase family protein [Acinetobacter gandensis]|uniref:phosphodiester glycosidase family protein n=1 Tax=Acinetobacter gandensis TaxID=1443941 RepID=UPI003F57CCF7
MYLEYLKTSVKILSALLIINLGIASTYAESSVRVFQVKKPILADVVEIGDFKNLKLHLNDTNSQPYQFISRLAADLQKNCRTMQFAMNAGMYHADLSPVGLYIEGAVEEKALNRATRGFGNFLIQPNGVLAWNHAQAKVETTQSYAKSSFKALYATQSGPMLVINGQINPNFIKNSDSLKIRNGVGIKDGKLYFVITNERVSFYNFADYFKTTLGVKNALYLDGSVSSVYIGELKRNDQLRPLGPIVAYSQVFNCR